MALVSFRRVWGWTTVALVGLWVIHRQIEGWLPLNWWPAYVVMAVLLLILSLVLAWPIASLVRLYQEHAHARGQR